MTISALTVGLLFLAVNQEPVMYLFKAAGQDQSLVEEFLKVQEDLKIKSLSEDEEIQKLVARRDEIIAETEQKLVKAGILNKSVLGKVVGDSTRVGTININSALPEDRQPERLEKSGDNPLPPTFVVTGINPAPQSTDTGGRNPGVTVKTLGDGSQLRTTNDNPALPDGRQPEQFEKSRDNPLPPTSVVTDINSGPQSGDMRGSYIDNSDVVGGNPGNGLSPLGGYTSTSRDNTSAREYNEFEQFVAELRSSYRRATTPYLEHGRRLEIMSMYTQYMEANVANELSDINAKIESRVAEISNLEKERAALITAYKVLLQIMGITIIVTLVELVSIWRPVRRYIVYSEEPTPSMRLGVWSGESAAVFMVFSLVVGLAATVFLIIRAPYIFDNDYLIIEYFGCSTLVYLFFRWVFFSPADENSGSDGA